MPPPALTSSNSTLLTDRSCIFPSCRPISPLIGPNTDMPCHSPDSTESTELRNYHRRGSRYSTSRAASCAKGATGQLFCGSRRLLSYSRHVMAIMKPVFSFSPHRERKYFVWLLPASQTAHSNHELLIYSDAYAMQSAPLKRR